MRQAPPPPPRDRTFYDPGYNGSPDCCCCNFLNCCFCCIFSLIFQILCALLVIAGIVVLILWLICRPNPVNFYVTHGSLTQFHLSSTKNILDYNLVLNMTVRNSNRRIGIYYDQIEVQSLYAGKIFGSTDVPGFYQGHKETDYLNPVLNGQSLVAFDSDDLSKFDMETQLERFSIDVKLNLQVRLKILLFKLPKSRLRVECYLRIPLDSEGRSSGYFETKKCDFNFKNH